MKVITAAQSSTTTSLPPNVLFIDELWKENDNYIWILYDAADVKLRLSIIAHTGAAGHRGLK